MTKHVTLVSSLHGQVPVLVDDAGLVDLADAAWTLDWWIGGDDRWYFPAQEPAVRQRRLGAGPVLETSMRIPSGDAVATVYGARSAGSGDDAHDVAVVEIANRSPVPVALVLAIVTRTAGVGSATVAQPKLMMVDDTTVALGDSHVLALPRPPSGSASSSGTDLAAVVVDGQKLGGLDPVDGPGANAVVMYPLPHGTSLRFAVGVAGYGGNPDSLPDAEQVSRGWSSIVQGGTRLSTPDSGIDALVDTARARLLIQPSDLLDEVDEVLGFGPDNSSAVASAVGGRGVAKLRRRFGRAGNRAAANPTTTSSPQASRAGDIAAALAIGGHFEDLERLLFHLAEHGVGQVPSAVAASRLTAGCCTGAALWLAVENDRARPVVDGALETLTVLTRWAERDRDPSTHDEAFAGLALVSQLLGQEDAAAALRQRITTWDATADPAMALGHANDLAQVMELAEQATEARSWPRLGVGGDAASTGRDSVTRAAEFALAARSMLLAEDLAGGIELLPRFPTAWRGGQVEIHHAPTVYGHLSYAIRWHGPRPALLWDLALAGPLAGDFAGLRCSALDPDWHTAAAAGETLLAGSGQGLGDAPAPGDSFS